MREYTIDLQGFEKWLNTQDLAVRMHGGGS